jgi:hypothetical protein
LAEEQDTLTIMIKREKQGAMDLESEIQRVERQIAQQRKAANLGPAGGASNPNQQSAGNSMPNVREKKDIGKRIVLLENRLDGVMIRYVFNVFIRVAVVGNEEIFQNN